MLGSKVAGFLLWFKKRHYRDVVMINGWPAVQVYKNLFGREYVLELNEKPPGCFNCRCVIVKREPDFTVADEDDGYQD